MSMKLTDFFKFVRLVPVPFGDYQGEKPETPPLMVNYRLPSEWRTIPVVLKDSERLYVDREIICKLSKVCAAKIGYMERKGQQLVIQLDNITSGDMERVLFATCPTIYGQYPIPPTVFDVDIICSVACDLQMDIVVKMCEQVLENDVHPELIATDLLIRLFNAAYKCQLKPTLQAKLLIKILECEYWKIKPQFIPIIESRCLRIFLWNFRKTVRYFACLKRARKVNSSVRRMKSWFALGADPLVTELLRLCTYSEMRFSHATITVSTKAYKSTCKQCEENVARITRTGGYVMRSAMEIPQKLFLCQQCSEALCLKCEAKFCAASFTTETQYDFAPAPAPPPRVVVGPPAPTPPPQMTAARGVQINALTVTKAPAPKTELPEAIRGPVLPPAYSRGSVPSVVKLQQSVTRTAESPFTKFTIRYGISDVLFVLNATGSVRHFFQQQKNYIADVAKQMNIGPNAQHVGLILYSSKYRKRIPLDEMLTKEQFISKVEALELSLEALQHRRKDKETVVVVLTDGYSLDHVDNGAKKLSALQNTVMYVAGVADPYEIGELEIIAGDGSRVLIGNVAKEKLISVLRCR